MEEIIINFVRDCPWLYDASRDDFRDNDKKENSWRKLSEMLKIDVSDVKKKWKSLRSSYARERRIPPTGSAGGKKKTWVHMEAMSFLYGHVKEKRQTTSNFNDMFPSSANENVEIILMDPETASNTTIQEDTFTSQDFRDHFDQPIPGTSQDQSLPSPGRFKGTKLLEIGSGAAVHNVASASAFFTNITMSDYVEDNCEELKKWLRGESPITQLLDFPAEFEGYGSDLKRGREMLEARIRRNVKRVDRCDVLTEDILFSQSSSPETSPPFDVVMSCLCLEAAPKDYEEYKKIFKRINRLLRPGGGLVISGCLGGDRWAIGEHKFNHIQINSEELLAAVKEASFGNVELKTYDRKMDIEYMYDKIYCLVAEKL